MLTPIGDEPPVNGPDTPILIGSAASDENATPIATAATIELSLALILPPPQKTNTMCGYTDIGHTTATANADRGRSSLRSHDRRALHYRLDRQTFIILNDVLICERRIR